VDFLKYQHIERFGTDEVDGIELGVCHVFAKIDGTNSSVWLEDGALRFGSRNRECTLEADNQGFVAFASVDPKIRGYLEAHPTHRLFGEWLVPHSLKTYRPDAWRRFYVFDVCIETARAEDEGPAEASEGIEYLPYEIYKPLLEAHGLDYIPLLAEVRNGAREQFERLMLENTYLVCDGRGAGEGIVVKNYGYRNKYGRVTWAKLVRNEFKEANAAAFGPRIVKGEAMIEAAIVSEFCTPALVEKEHAKIVAEVGVWKSEMIPRLLGTVFHALVTECGWEMVKKHRNPTINYKTLNALTIQQIKTAKPEIFA
jgi:hypothetical protein